MKVEDLIKELEKLPGEATIGTFNAEDYCISKTVYIYEKGDCCSNGASIKDIENGRRSNENRLCDYYIGY